MPKRPIKLRRPMLLSWPESKCKSVFASRLRLLCLHGKERKVLEKQLDTPEANASLNIMITSEAQEVMTWRMLARQTVPMLTRPEQFHISQRKQLAQTICLLLSGDLELEHVFGVAEEDDQDV